MLRLPDRPATVLLGDLCDVAKDGRILIAASGAVQRTDHLGAELDGGVEEVALRNPAQGRHKIGYWLKSPPIAFGRITFRTVAG
jgi:hypothetical protein